MRKQKRIKMGFIAKKQALRFSLYFELGRKSRDKENGLHC